MKKIYKSLTILCSVLLLANTSHSSSSGSNEEVIYASNYMTSLRIQESLKETHRDKLLSCGIASIPIGIFYTIESVPLVGYLKITKVPKLVVLLKSATQSKLISPILISIFAARLMTGAMVFGSGENDIGTIEVNLALGGASIFVDMVIEGTVTPENKKYHNANYRMSELVEDLFKEEVTDCAELESKVQHLAILLDIYQRSINEQFLK